MAYRQLTPRKDRKSSRNRSPRKSPKSNDTSGSGATKECACGRGMACAGMTQAFRLLGDYRRNFVELPHYRHDPPSFKYVFRNNLRASYTRNLAKCNSNLDMSKFDDVRKRRFVAMHHFHPSIVQAFYDNPLTSAQKHMVPISITEHEMRELNIEMCKEDRIMTVGGAPTGGYFFVPNYPPTNVHEDLKTLVRAERKTRETNESPEKSSEGESNEDKEAQASVSLGHLVPNDEKFEFKEPRKALIVDEDVDEVADDSSTEDVVDASKDKEVSESADFDDDIIEKDDEPSKFDELWGKENPPADTEMEKHPAIVFEEALPGVAQSSETKVEDEHDAQEVESSAAPVAQSIDATDSEEERDHSELLIASAPRSVDERKEQLESEDGGKDEDSESHIPPSLLATDEIEPEKAGKEQGGDEHAEPEVANGTQTSDEADAKREEDEANACDLPSPDSSDEGSEVEEEATEMVGVTVAQQLGSGGDLFEKKEEVADELRSADSWEDSSESSSPRKLTAQNSDHPWDLSKYRTVKLETQQKRTSAAFIEPKRQSPSKEASESSTSETGEMSPMKTPAGMNIIQEGGRETSTGTETGTETETETGTEIDPPFTDVQKQYPLGDPEHQYLEFYDDEDSKLRNKYRASFAIAKTSSQDSGESKSAASVESISSTMIGLDHGQPGADPTLRIQVHNDLIAIESKRRSQMNILMDYHKEQWYAAKEILQTGVQNVEFAERLVSGFAQAGMVFADSLEAMYEDRFLDDRGKMVKSTFVQNRLHKKRSSQEYSIDAAKGELGQSALLNSLIEAQLVMAQSFDENARHLIEEMLPEITDLKNEIEASAQELESLGDSIVRHLISSEVEVKNLWDVFDALITGDLMEFSVHGSQHGSSHGESIHSVNSASLHGMIPEVSSNASATFRRLDSIGSIEDGWLIELLYKSAISYQKSVFRFAQPELEKVYKEISIFEEKRLRKLHPLMMAFVPRQKRLFDALPDHMKGVLDDLVGFRIDEESLQAHIDETLRDRSSDRLKKSEKHRSSIMNRSRLKAVKDTPETVEEIERVFGSPYFSSLILLSKVVELKPFGFSGIVNNSWRFAIVVVTNEGNFHVFMMPREADSPLEQSPLEAFRSLYPAMQFETRLDWVRKLEIKPLLTPSITLDLRRCNIHVSTIRNSELEVEEEEVQTRSSFFGKKILKAVKDGGQRPTRCTVRLPSAIDASQWAGILRKTKKDLIKKQKQQRS